MNDLTEMIEDAAEEYYKKNLKQPTHLILNKLAWDEICDMARPDFRAEIPIETDKPHITVYNSSGGSTLLVSISTAKKSSRYYVEVAG